MIAIRTATTDELPTLRLLRNRSAAAGCASRYSAAVLEAWLSSPLPTEYGRLIDAGTVFVAETDGRLIGYGAIDLPARKVVAIFVDPTAFGLGIGRRLLQAVEARAAREGVDTVFLSSSLNAETFYATAGYVALYGEQHPLHGGESLAAVRMQKQLSSRNPPENIAERLAHATGWNDFRDLRRLLSEWKPADLYELLFPPAIASRDEGASGIAGCLLVALQPDCPEPVADVIAKIHASQWFVSYREVPFYLITQFGKRAIVTAAEEFIAALPQPSNSRVESVLYWMRTPASELCEPFHDWNTEGLMS